MFKRLLFLFLVFLLIAYQYGIVIFLVSSTYFASLWAILIFAVTLLIFLFSDKLILFSMRPVPITAKRTSSRLNSIVRFLDLSSISIFHIRGKAIYTFRGFLGGRYLCIGRDLLKENNEAELTEIINLAVVSSEKPFQLIDQTLYCLIKLLFLPATTLERFLKYNFVSSFLVWIYYPVKSLILTSVYQESESIKEDIYECLEMTERELNFLKVKYNLHYNDPLETLISSNLVMGQGSHSFEHNPALSAT